MFHRIKPMLVALALAGAGQGVQAAYLDYVSHLGYGAYSAVGPGGIVDDSLLDLSAPPTEVTFFGAGNFASALDAGTVDHGYAGDAFLHFSGAGTDFAISLSQFLSVQANGSLSGITHQQEAAVDLAVVTMKIMGDPGQAAGFPVIVSFHGGASALSDFSSMASGAYLSLGLSVSRGSEVLAEYLWDVPSSGDQPVTFSFAGQVGEELTLSAFALTGVGLSDAAFAASATPYLVGESLGALSGSLSVTAVPEPESIAMLLAGLGVLGVHLRRRGRRQQVG